MGCIGFGGLRTFRPDADHHRAARGTSLARIYDDLGFEQLGQNEATRSLSFDPTAAPAHRFLSDIYGSARRREIARVSELLQSMPGLGKVRAAAVMERLNISESRRVRGLGSKQVAALIAEFSDTTRRP